MKKPSINSSKPTVLMIGPYPPPYGGIAVVIRDLIDEPSLKNNFDIRLLKIAPQKKGLNKKHISFFEEIWRVSHDLSSLIKNLIVFKPTIVHIHTSYDWGWPKNVLYAIISKLFRSHVILHIHAYHPLCRNDYPNVWLKRFLFPPKFVFQITDCIFTLSNRYTQRIQTQTSNPVVTIPNGIMLQKFLNRDKGKKPTGFVVTYLGSLRKSKGIFEFMKSTTELISKYNDMKFIIAGDGPEKEELLKWRESLTSDNVNYVGVVDEEKIEILHQTDIFVLPSYSEALPISILEAIAAGCAIITTPVGEISSVIKDGYNGLFIPPKDDDAITKTILKLYLDRKLLKELQKNNINERVKYSWETISKKISETYTKMLIGSSHG